MIPLYLYAVSAACCTNQRELPSHDDENQILQQQLLAARLHLTIILLRKTDSAHHVHHVCSQIEETLLCILQGRTISVVYV